jgi:hypothetical protein
MIVIKFLAATYQKKCGGLDFQPGVPAHQEVRYTMPARRHKQPLRKAY